MIELNNEENILKLYEDIKSSEMVAMDTETTGLKFTDKAFVITFATDKETYYYEVPKDGVHSHIFACIDHAFMNKLCIFANAKFDIFHLRKLFSMLGFPRQIWDVLIVDRLLYNDWPKYNLASVAERWKFKKGEEVSDYVQKEKCFTWEVTNGSTEKKMLRYDWVPKNILKQYATNDARITYDICVKQKAAFAKKEYKDIYRDEMPVVVQEMQLIPVLTQMYESGVLIDRAYVQMAYDSCVAQYKKLLTEMQKWTTTVVEDSETCLRKIFESLGFELKFTEKGSLNTDKHVLKKYEHPFTDLLLEYRKYYKKAHTYFGSFLYLADENNYIHASLNQSGTRSGRMSCSEPNLQNLHKEEDLEGDDDSGEWPIRRSFIPPPGYVLVGIDYKAFEFRAILDRAGEVEVLERIKNGEDPHEVTASICNLKRKQAKNVAFASVYGAGIPKFASMVGATIEEAKEMYDKFFAGVGRVKSFMDDIQKTAKKRGFIINAFGRRYYFNSWFAYRAPNYYIQGSTAEAVKKAMIDINNHPAQNDFKMVLQIHDEILFYVKKDCPHLPLQFAKIMAESYPVVHKEYPMECDISHSFKSWQDLTKGLWDESQKQNLENAS